MIWIALHTSVTGGDRHSCGPQHALTPLHGPRRGPLDRIRLGLALSAGKLTTNAGRLLRVGGGTSLPGILARRIDPQVLRTVVGASAARKIVVTGSNGKTTMCRMIAALAQAAGRRITQNRAGSNLVQDITGSCGRSTGFRSGHACRWRRPGSAGFQPAGVSR